MGITSYTHYTTEIGRVNFVLFGMQAGHLVLIWQ
jgi:hypothetical protein